MQNIVNHNDYQYKEWGNTSAPEDKQITNVKPNPFLKKLIYWSVSFHLKKILLSCILLWTTNKTSFLAISSNFFVVTSPGMTPLQKLWESLIDMLSVFKCTTFKKLFHIDQTELDKNIYNTIHYLAIIKKLYPLY